MLENKPKDFDDFISQMIEKGYSIKFGKHISFSHSRQRKNIRLRSLGTEYSEEEIKSIISTKGKAKSQKEKKNEKQKTNLLIDVQQKI